MLRTAFRIAFVRESEKALLVPVSTKGIAADHEPGETAVFAGKSAIPLFSAAFLVLIK